MTEEEIISEDWYYCGHYWCDGHATSTQKCIDADEETSQ